MSYLFFESNGHDDVEAYALQHRLGTEPWALNARTEDHVLRWSWTRPSIDLAQTWPCVSSFWEENIGGGVRRRWSDGPKWSVLVGMGLFTILSLVFLLIGGIHKPPLHLCGQLGWFGV
jgi:hypothetical protein